VDLFSNKEPSKSDGFDDMVISEVADLSTQFHRRPLWILCEDLEEEQDRLTPHYWFPSCALEDLAEETEPGETMTADLEKLRQEFLPQFDPKEELLRRVTAKQVERAKRKQIRPGIINTSRGERKGPAPPMRGRGFVPRGGMNSRMNDHFRNRPQNTSRAPSMHVDDFIVMESHAKDGGAPDSKVRERDQDQRSGERSARMPGLRSKPQVRSPSPGSSAASKDRGSSSGGFIKPAAGASGGRRSPRSAPRPPYGGKSRDRDPRARITTASGSSSRSRKAPPPSRRSARSGN